MMAIRNRKHLNMSPQGIVNELSLAAWEMAEAATLEKKAAKLRLSSTNRIAAIHLEFTEAMKTAKEKDKNQQHC
jgi:hypothetical protein